MSPRPVEFPPSEFDDAVRLAREGRARDALAAARQAAGALDRASSRLAGAANALAEIGRLAEEAGDVVTAEGALQDAVRLRPRFADLHFRHACVLLRCRRRPEARRALEAALRVNPGYPAARLELALLDAREGLVGEALDGLRALSADGAVDDEGAFGQGLRRLERAEWDEAEAFLRRALHLGQDDLDEALQSVRALLEAGEASRAASLLRDLVPRHRAYPDLHALLGRAELALGHNDDALLSLSAALELNPGFHGARLLLSQALECLGQADQALEQIELVLQHEPGHVEALEQRRLWSERHARARRGAASR